MSFIRLLFALGLVLPALAAAATPNAATAGPPDTTSLPYVTGISTLPEHPNPFEPTRLVIEGQYPNLCGEILDPGVAGIVVFINARNDCRDPLFEGWRKEFDLGHLAAGWHQVQITLMVQFPGAIDPDVYYQRHTIFVSPDSTHGPLPFVDEIRILNGRTDQPGLCSTDSILVRTSGMFPSSCYGLKAIELLPSPVLGGPLPQPPLVRYVIEHCPNDPCGTVMVPWDSYVMLPPLPASEHYPLFVQVAQVACGDTVLSDSSVYSTIVPFRVDRCDSTPVEPCVRGDWQHREGACDALLHEGQAQVVFTVQTGKNLAGLQGAFSVHPPGLRIARLDAIGPAEGMHVTWRATDNGGVRFNMFSDTGAPIPAVSAGNPDGGPVPILKVTLQAVQRPIPEMTWVQARELLGSDEHGNAVYECIILTPVIVAARVCSERGCDFNADGASDVRDLVMMARCVFGTAQDSAGNFYRQMCADSASVPDCNNDGQKSIADAVCCALKILRGSDCPGCPDDSTGGRPAPNVRVTLRDPEVTATGADVVIDVEGLSGVGGAVLGLKFPADRYTAQVLHGGGTSYGWLNLSDVLNGTATIALVRALDPLGPVPMFAPGEPMKLRLTLKPGMTHGGVVKLERFEVSDPDGAKLIPDAEDAVVPLGVRAQVALSEARPNPVSDETRFRLTLDRGSDVSVAIYDLGGRLVTTLHRGHLAAGSHDFMWNGTQKSGARLPGGVYFYRATAGTAHASRKLVLLDR